jgi:hypothetical protein
MRLFLLFCALLVGLVVSNKYIVSEFYLNTTCAGDVINGNVWHSGECIPGESLSFKYTVISNVIYRFDHMCNYDCSRCDQFNVLNYTCADFRDSSLRIKAADTPPTLNTHGFFMGFYLRSESCNARQITAMGYFPKGLNCQKQGRTPFGHMIGKENEWVTVTWNSEMRGIEHYTYNDEKCTDLIRRTFYSGNSCIHIRGWEPQMRAFVTRDYK